LGAACIVCVYVVTHRWLRMFPQRGNLWRRCPAIHLNGAVLRRGGSPLGQPCQGIDRGSVIANFKVKVRTGAQPGATNEADDLPSGDRLVY
jgi:hypothetical protein